MTIQLANTKKTKKAEAKKMAVRIVAIVLAALFVIGGIVAVVAR